MIVNTNIYNGGGITAPPIPSESNEYENFLKRKLNNEKDMQTHKGNDGKNIKEAKCKSEKKCYIHLEDNAQSWKKRHVEEKKIYENQNLGETKNKGGPASSSLNSHTSHFNIITSNGFMSDLLDYEPNLLNPVSSNSTMAAEDGPIFTTNTSAICVNTTAEFESSVDDNWHASDLLELDHRYNSSLQTEITQLKPTIALKNSEIPLHSLNGHNNYSNPTGDSSFLMPPSRCTPIQRDLTLSTPTPSKNENINNLSVNHENETDFEDKNLSWLLNFKFDELPHLSPDLSKSGRNVQSNSTANSITSYQNSITQLTSVTSNVTNGYLNKEQSRSPKNITKVGKKFEELVMEVTSDIDGQHDCDSQQMTITTENNLQAETHILAQKKPPFTYTELIEYALEDKGELTVSGIYQWISDRFPYYKSNDDRWKNSVRHNLSINPHFRKGIKAPQGAGHLWTIYSGDSAENVLAWEHKKQRLELFFKMEAINRERLLEYHQQQQQQQQRALKEEQTSRTFNCQPESDGITGSKVCGFDEAAVAVATLQQEMLQQQSDTSHCNGADNVLDASNHVLHTLPYADLLCSEEELRKTAGQILNGIHRDVEVQAVNQNIISTYQDVLLDNEDYLNPIHKDVAVNESGLRHSTPSSSLSHCTSSPHTSAQYYVGDIDALGLGMQMSSRARNRSHASCSDNASGGEDPDVGLFNDEYNLNYFNYANVQDTIS